MSNCEKCNFPLPDRAEYCPNCGVQVRKKTEIVKLSTAPIVKILQMGLFGAFLSVMISSLLPTDIQLYFIPSFISSLIAVYFSRVRRLNESITIALSVYFFADAILGAIIFGSIYTQKIPLSEAYGDYVLTLVDVVMYLGNPVTAILAGYIGNKMVSRTELREPLPFSYGRKEEPGGIIYSL